MDMGLRAEKKCPTNQQIFTRHLLGARSSVGAEVGGQPLLQGDQSLGQGASTGCWRRLLQMLTSDARTLTMGRLRESGWQGPLL